ncbi:FAD-dependent monooxygenase [Nocardioides sp. CFH 31398]|uniref:FAD-dependent oxidoreductase n=1 Tax=Nocardioides sp. CFH 31398 TaxID=2919579 RepID=UPI001F05675D|nr:FAD-dependent monooxygenase [Nocardioides sp. CFH 31398]MCH1866008.1 FAD-dependent monooxygenase [Nocardioides sp. CFH 31398]
MHVVVVGAGIGGLALAQGLLASGIRATVLERGTDLRATGGYSLHLSPEAVTGLRALLPPDRLGQLLGVERASEVARDHAVRDHRGRLVVVDRSPRADGTLDVDRITLRLLLAHGLGEHLRLGVSGVGYDQQDDGTVVVRTAAEDGTTGEVRCDVLVAADGVGSAVATQLAGGPTSTPVGLMGVAGRTAQSSVPPGTRDLLRSRSTLAVGPGGSGLYVGNHAALDQVAVSRFVAPPPWGVGESYVWGAILLDWASTRSLARLAGRPLVAAAAAQLRDRSWDGPILDVVEHTDPVTASAFRFHAAARYPAGLAPWAPGPVTALGDAVHAMPPTGGQGASTALRDAHLLRDALVEVETGRRPLVSAVDDYHRAMRPYAAAAVAASLQPVGWTRTSRKPLGTAVAQAGMPAAAAVSWAVRAGRRGDAAGVLVGDR